MKEFGLSIFPLKPRGQCGCPASEAPGPALTSARTRSSRKGQKHPDYPFITSIYIILEYSRLRERLTSCTRRKGFYFRNCLRTRERAAGSGCSLSREYRATQLIKHLRLASLHNKNSRKTFNSQPGTRCSERPAAVEGQMCPWHGLNLLTILCNVCWKFPALES